MIMYIIQYNRRADLDLEISISLPGLWSEFLIIVGYCSAEYVVVERTSFYLKLYIIIHIIIIVLIIKTIIVSKVFEGGIYCFIHGLFISKMSTLAMGLTTMTALFSLLSMKLKNSVPSDTLSGTTCT